MDRHEGTISWMQPGKCRVVINGMDISDDLAGPVYAQRHWLNHLNVFCLHAAHSGDLNLANLSNIESLRQELTRIMREGAVEGETQEPPCGTNVVHTTF